MAMTTPDPEHDRLIAVAEGRGVADRVRLIGQVAHVDMPALLRAAALTICSPRYSRSASRRWRRWLAAYHRGQRRRRHVGTVVDSVTGAR